MVSSSILGKIALHHSIQFHETLTGFKWLAKVENLRFGYEEALGYAVDPHRVNDKDGISAALLLTQCASELKNMGKSMTSYLSEIWNIYGYHGTDQISIRVHDISDVEEVLARVRANHPAKLAGKILTQFVDLSKPKGSLPPTNGITMWFGDNLRVIIRPSGTEAKLKCYIEASSAGGSDEQIQEVDELLARLKIELLEILKV
jgi:phosphomannomutase